MLTVEMSRIDHLVSYLYWLTDAEISESQWFPGHVADYTANPCWCHKHPAKNAYHVRYLAEAMVANGGVWIGDPAIIKLSAQHKLVSGNHRVRGVGWLAQTRGVAVRVPVEVQD